MTDFHAYIRILKYVIALSRNIFGKTDCYMQFYIEMVDIKSLYLFKDR